jgi:hypothetical protein
MSPELFHSVPFSTISVPFTVPGPGPCFWAAGLPPPSHSPPPHPPAPASAQGPALGPWEHIHKVAEGFFRNGFLSDLDALEQNSKLRPKASLHKRGGLRRLPQKGRASPRPAPFVGILMAAGFRPEFGVWLQSI